jgi:chaperone modulatory protein CbpM
MNAEYAQAFYLNETEALSLPELVERSGLSEQELRALVECGALPPEDTDTRTWTFSARCVVVARTAHRLREEFALDDTHSLAVVVRLEQRIEALESELRALRGLR